jgi:asparaginyl-tRNA synthetase
MATPLSLLQVDTPVSVFGWVRTARLAKKDTLLFVEIDDGTATVQCIVRGVDAALKTISATGSGVVFSGMLVTAPDAASQDVEFRVAKVLHVGACPPEIYPLPKSSRDPMTLVNLRAIPHLRLRDSRLALAQRVRSRLTLATHMFFQDRQFLQAHTPIITTSDCEGAGEMFRIAKVNGDREFFGEPAYLTVSGQLEGEQMAIGGGMGRVYTFGPTFRAEDSHTSRHLSEFWMIEPEWGCVNGIAELADMAEAYVRACARAVADLDGVDAGIIESIDTPFMRITYTEAIVLLATAHAETPRGDAPIWGVDLSSDQERWLVAHHGGVPLVVTGYPKEIKSFYMKVDAADPRTVQAMDVLVPGIGELIGGSVREDGLDVLATRMTDCGLDKAQYTSYLDTRRFGSIPHCGFGLGFERLVMLLTGLSNIRDVVPFPRCPGHAS